MKLLADESVDFPIIQLLRSHHYDVRSVSEEYPGTEGDFVLSLANEESRILITSDKDFRELVYRLRTASRGAPFTVIGSKIVRIRRV